MWQRNNPGKIPKIKLPKDKTEEIRKKKQAIKEEDEFIDNE